MFMRRIQFKANMSQCRVLVVGGGGREHALCKAIAKSEKLLELHCTPGNAGTAKFATNHDVKASDIDGLVSLAVSLSCDLVIAGPEGPLCDGLADSLAKQKIPCFGPIAALAHLEGSKKFAKEMMQKAGVPTAGYDILDATSNIEQALKAKSNAPFVIKRDVLAGGKGVVVTSDMNEATDFILQSIKTDGYVLLEEFLPGQEASMLVVMDKNSFIPLPCSQDHKRAYDGDEGPNTGGMGAYCPAPIVTDEVHLKVIERIVSPMHQHLSSLDQPYRGVLYVGLMIDEKNDPYVVEFNVRFGDPECQVTLPLIKSDVLEMLYSAATDQLQNYLAEYHERYALTIVLASEGYPASAKTGRIIRGLAAFERERESDSLWVDHAATTLNEMGEFVSSGGRVLSVTSMEHTLEESYSKAYEAMNFIQLEGAHFRNDIGRKAFNSN
jgi:phosphoribosylamine--glycine ligase